jgi:hypothetical protein
MAGHTYYVGAFGQQGLGYGTTKASAGATYYK